MIRLTIRIDDALHAALKATAKADGRSLNGWVTRTLAGAVKAPKGKP